jgi:hypothetical protein
LDKRSSTSQTLDTKIHKSCCHVGILEGTIRCLLGSSIQITFCSQTIKLLEFRCRGSRLGCSWFSFKGVVPPPWPWHSRVPRSPYIRGLGVHLLGVNEKKKLSPDQGRTATQLFPSNCRGVRTQVYHDLHLNFAPVMKAHLQGLQGKPMCSNLVCKTARYRGTTPLSKGPVVLFVAKEKKQIARILCPLNRWP